MAALRMPLRGENSDIPHEYFSLHFKSSHGGAPQQRQGQICVPVVSGESICQKGSKNLDNAIRWRFVVQRSRY